jgi:hypothetical protein
MADKKGATKRAATAKSGNVWTDEERAAMQESARERKTASRRGGATEAEQRAQGEQEVREKIAALPEPDRSMAARFHELVTRSIPSLMPRTYYGMPAYAMNGKTICFYKPASKFKERYASLGFEQHAKLDEGSMWPTSYALTELSEANASRIVEIIRKAVG